MKLYTNYENRLAYLNRKTIETRRYVTSLTMFYNIFHKYVAYNILDSFTAPAHNRNLRVIITSFVYIFVKQIFETIF